MEVISYFSMREWKFSNKNLQSLWCKLEAEDRRMFPFSMKNFDLKNYMHFCIKGIRVYLVKDPMETVKAAKIKHKLLTVAHSVLVFVLVLSILMFFYYILKFFI